MSIPTTTGQHMTEAETDDLFCGCCGSPIGKSTRSDPHWCGLCAEHVKQFSAVLAWERTYYAVHKRPCPYQVGEK